MSSILQALSCADNYDPNSLHVERARGLILGLLPPVTGVERVFIRQALDRVLAADVISPIDVPSHDNSAMDGWALRFADLATGGESRLKNIGTAFAGRAFDGRVGTGETVRIMTGAVLPEGVDTVVIQEVTRVEGDAVIIPAGQQRGQNTRRAGETDGGRLQRPTLRGDDGLQRRNGADDDFAQCDDGQQAVAQLRLERLPEGVVLGKCQSRDKLTEAKRRRQNGELSRCVAPPRGRSIHNTQRAARDIGRRAADFRGNSA